MKVSRNSWHYRLWKYGREPYGGEPRDLCRYFWHILLMKILVPIVVIGLVITGIVAILVSVWNHPLDAAIVVGIALGLVVLLVAVGYFHQRREDREEERRNSGAPRKEPGLARQYLAARKRKLCPLIEVVDEKGER